MRVFICLALAHSECKPNWYLFNQKNRKDLLFIQVDRSRSSESSGSQQKLSDAKLSGKNLVENTFSLKHLNSVNSVVLLLRNEPGREVQNVYNDLSILMLLKHRFFPLVFAMMFFTIS